jgi:hypothetical protein
MRTKSLYIRFILFAYAVMTEDLRLTEEKRPKTTTYLPLGVNLP